MISSLTECIAPMPSPTLPWWHAVLFFFKDKVKILKAKRKLQGTNVFIAKDFSSRVRDVRRRLVPHLKKARSENKKCMMVFDHLIIDAKKFALDDGDNLKEMR